MDFFKVLITNAESPNVLYEILHLDVENKYEAQGFWMVLDISGRKVNTEHLWICRWWVLFQTHWSRMSNLQLSVVQAGAAHLTFTLKILCGWSKISGWVSLLHRRCSHLFSLPSRKPFYRGQIWRKSPFTHAKGGFICLIWLLRQWGRGVPFQKLGDPHNGGDKGP